MEVKKRNGTIVLILAVTMICLGCKQSGDIDRSMRLEGPGEKNPLTKRDMIKRDSVDQPDTSAKRKR